MIKFIERNKEIISTLSIVALVATLSNNANAETRISDKNNLSIEQAQEQENASKEVFLVSKEENNETNKKYKYGTPLEKNELIKILKNVGFEGYSLKVAWATVMKESMGTPNSWNPNRKTGDNSYGLFQINMLGELGEERRSKFNLKSNEDLFNPVRNAEIAYHMSNGGEDWSAWKGITWKTKEWMERF